MRKSYKNQAGYTAVEALLILVALAIVGLVAWYVHHATTSANASYSVQESSQKPASPKKASPGKTTAPAAAASTTANQ